ncbi:MAG: hypothetical protein P8Q98_03960, partial [Candidatus Poseidoniaceae archaeon]|nr:hypothetical protein [Candidatus Poseidoniaceae archaeon]
MTDRKKEKSMRAVVMCSILLAALLVPIAGAAASQTGEVDSQWAPLSDSTHHPIIDSYSPSVRASIAFHSDVSQYTDEQLTSAVEWVVFSKHPLGTPSEALLGAQVVPLKASEAASTLANWQASGLIEAAYPLIERTMEPRW